MGFNDTQSVYSYDTIRPLLFSSKSQYDQLAVKGVFNFILSKLNGGKIYSDQNLTLISTGLSRTQGINIVSNKYLVEFYLFHKALVNMLDIGRDLLLKEEITLNNEYSLDNGVLIFQIVIEGNLDLELYVKIFTLINELVETINKAKGFSESSPTEVILLDSGSDTNLGIKAKAETVKSLFLIFKEIWEFITNYNFYKVKQQNDSLLESLTIRKEIMQMQKEGVISEEEAKVYNHIVKSRVETLIGMKVLPKELVQNSSTIDNRFLLNEYERLRLLNPTNGENNNI